jgi:hypothetical protein
MRASRRLHSWDTRSSTLGHPSSVAYPFPTFRLSTDHTGSMTKTKMPGTEMELARRQHPVVMLHEAGFSYRRISELTGVSKSSAQRIYRDALAETRGIRDIERHRATLCADLEMLIETLRPLVHDDENPPSADDVTSFLRALGAKAKLLGLNAPARTQLAPVDNNNVVNPEAALFLAELNIWLRETHSYDERTGWHSPPALPPGMTERVNGNGHGELSPPGQGMWSRVLVNPEDDHDDHHSGSTEHRILMDL